MLNIRHFLVSVALLMAFTTTNPALALDADDLSNPLVVEAFIDAIVKPLMAEGHSPSGTFALMKGDQLIFAKGYGWQDVEKRIPVDPYKTLFRPGSISKLFTWVSVMQMVEQGKLDLDTDINTYLKTFQIKDTFPGQPITLRHCMTHTPGFEDGALGYLIIEDAAKVMPLAEAMAKYQPERVNPPGKIGAYSNYCTSIAGLAVANVSGLDFTDYVRKNIFDVLGMRSSSFKEPLPEGLDQNMATAYKYENGKYIARPYELVTNFSPAGALAATSTDLLKFGGALLHGGEFNGGRILQPESLEEMKKIQFTYDDRVKGIGLGFLQYPFGNTDTFGHDGGTTAFVSHFGVTPSADLVVASSFSGPGGGKVNANLTRQFYEEFFPNAQHNDDPPAGFDARAKDYAGTYISWRGSFTKMEKLLGLMGQVQITPNGEGELMIGESRWVEIDNNLFRAVESGDTLAFQTDANGTVIGFVQNGWPIMSMYKADGWASQAFNFGLLGFSLFVFLAVFLRYLYQRGSYKSLQGGDKSAARAAVLASVSHLWVIVFGAITIITVGDQLMARIPTLFTVWLVFPIIATLASLYLLYQTALVWKNGLLSGVFMRLRYTVVCFCALFMAWFYYFWRILGFNYY